MLPTDRPIDPAGPVTIGMHTRIANCGQHSINTEWTDYLDDDKGLMDAQDATQLLCRDALGGALRTRRRPFEKQRLRVRQEYSWRAHKARVGIRMQFACFKTQDCFLMFSPIGTTRTSGKKNE